MSGQMFLYIYLTGLCKIFIQTDTLQQICGISRDGKKQEQGWFDS